MTLIAQLTDLHILEPHHWKRSAAARWRVSLASFGRRLDAGERRRRALRAVQAASAAGADHILITGDLTEDGTLAQFETLAETLLESGVDPARLTLVPGNHDAYAGEATWQEALEGPLRPFRRTSLPGSVITLDDVAIVPVSTAQQQPLTRSGGEIGSSDLRAIDELARSRDLRERSILVAQHHPPLPYAVPLVQWVHGLRGHRSYRALLARHERVHVVHGHTHRLEQARCGRWPWPRVFSASAVVSSDDPVRMYRARDGRLRPLRAGLPARQPAGEPAVAARAPSPGGRSILTHPARATLQIVP